MRTIVSKTMMLGNKKRIIVRARELSTQSLFSSPVKWIKGVLGSSEPQPSTSLSREGLATAHLTPEMTRGIKFPDPSQFRSLGNTENDHIFHPHKNPSWKVVTRAHFESCPNLYPTNWPEQLAQFQHDIGVSFHDPGLLMSALTHSGALNKYQIDLSEWDEKNIPAHRMSNRTLETLGDSVLGLVISSHLFQLYPEYQEGALTKLKASIVNNKMLSDIGENVLKIDTLILSSDSTWDKNSTQYLHGRQTLRAGAVEALIGALYLDQGLDTASSFIQSQILPHAMDNLTTSSSTTSALHDDISFVHSKLKGCRYTYHDMGNGQPFRVKMYVQNKVVVEAHGRSKKEARKAACTKVIPLLDSIISGMQETKPKSVSTVQVNHIFQQSKATPPVYELVSGSWGNRYGMKSIGMYTKKSNSLLAVGESHKSAKFSKTSAAEQFLIKWNKGELSPKDLH